MYPDIQKYTKLAGENNYPMEWVRQLYLAGLSDDDIETCIENDVHPDTVQAMNAYCNIDDEEIVPATLEEVEQIESEYQAALKCKSGHQWGEWEYHEGDDEDDLGYRLRVCLECGEVDIDPIESDFEDEFIPIDEW